jgi:GalNAc-alpha-(1->4)-GalNAc-alpha-(1->3)-diNAcBac-PP-undecaprenol alpha-1,4-N-acetyl-D-galactosaminyltransferase
MSRIFLICVSLKAGGTERIVSMLANHFVGQHEVDVILFSPKNPFYKLNSRVRLWQFSGKCPGLWRALYYPRVARFIRSIVKERKPDVLLSFGELISPFVRVASSGLGVKVFVFNRGSPFRSLRGISGWVNPLIYPFTDGVVVQTEQAVTILKNRYRFCQFRVIPNPVEIPSVVPPLRVREKVAVYIGSIGRLKNQESLIRSFATTKAGANWKLYFVGDGPDRRRLEALVEQIGLSTRIRFLGERSDVAQILFNAQIFAFTSLSEGFPNALAEALAAGCACISYDCPTGPSELIEDGINGLLVPVGDQAAFARGLDQLMDDLDLRTRLSRAARAHIQQFASEHIFEQYEQLI